MSIHGVQNPLLGSLGTVGRPGAPRPGQLQPDGQPAIGVRPGARPATPTPAALRPQPSLAVPATTLPAEAPQGTDPALWSVLTTEERAYFAKASAMGPLTYGRVAAGINPNANANAAPAVRGGRLDVRA